MKELESDHGDTMGELEEQNVTTYFFSRDPATNGKRANNSEHQIPQSTVHKTSLKKRA